MTPPRQLTAWAVPGIPEVTTGTDLVALITGGTALRSGDVVLVTSKVVSKAEGQVVHQDRSAAVIDETVRVVARRGSTTIVENRQGLVLAAAGVDGSNVAAGSVVLLPEDPDRSARQLRRGLFEATGADVAVVVTDTAGRPWRTGQTDIAIGVAGLLPLVDHSGQRDAHGNELAVTAPAVADELAGLAELVAGKLGGRPVVVVRGLPGMVLAPGDDGPGARALQRPRWEDMFALGAREAVVAAVAGTDADCFGSPATPEEVVAALQRCGLSAQSVGSSVTVALEGLGRGAQVVAAERARLVAHAHGWRPQSDTVARGVTLSPRPTARGGTAPDAS